MDASIAHADAKAPAVRAGECPLVAAPSSLVRKTPRATAWFGTPLAADGDTLVVAASLDRDPPFVTVDHGEMCDPESESKNTAKGFAIRVYEQNAGEFTESILPMERQDASLPFVPLTIVPDFARQGTYITYSLAVSGKWLAVGMAGDGTHAEYQGSVQLFSRNGEGWDRWPGILEIPDGRANDLYGYSVALSGDVLVVGAPGATGAPSCEGACGAAYAYILTDSGPTSATVLSAPLPQQKAGFGLSVAASPERVVVGAPLEQPPESSMGAVGEARRGTVYVYARRGDTFEPAYSIASTPPVDAFFGWSMSLRGDHLAVGTPNAIVHRPGLQSGAVRILRLGNQDATELITLGNPDMEQQSFFGFSVALGAHSLVVGAPFMSPRIVEDDGAVTASYAGGGAFVFQRTDDDSYSSEPCTLTVRVKDPCAIFGHAVAVGGDYLAVGAPLQDVAQLVDTGATYVYRTRRPP